MSARPAQALAPPLHGGPYLNFNGCCDLSPHRTALVPVDGTPYLAQRFAVDFIRIDNLGRGAVGDLTRNESFFTFGEPVYAIADGRVVRTRNNLPETPPLNEPPGSSFTTQTTLGNNVELKLRGGRYALYADLETGSIRVRPGQRVHSGQMPGRVGTPPVRWRARALPNQRRAKPSCVQRFALRTRTLHAHRHGHQRRSVLSGTANADVYRLRPPSPRRGQLPLHATVVRFPH